MYPARTRSPLKVAAISFGALVLAIVGIWGVYRAVIANSSKVSVSVVIAPRDAEATLKGKHETISLNTSGTTRIEPGDYTLSIKRDGFVSVKEDITVDDSDTPISYGLEPETEEAFEIVEKDFKQYEEIDNLGSQEVSESTIELNEKYPALASLPYQHSYYQIDYRIPKDDATPVIIIRSGSPQYRHEAIQKLYSFSGNPADYEIEFANYKSPLKNGAN